jgi:hypothetical protein
LKLKLTNIPLCAILPGGNGGVGDAQDRIPALRRLYYNSEHGKIIKKLNEDTKDKHETNIRTGKIGCLWLMAVILTTWDVEIRKIMVQGQSGQIVCETSSPK